MLALILTCVLAQERQVAQGPSLKDPKSVQTRTFAVSADGKRGGAYTQTIADFGNGMFFVMAQSEVHFKVLIKKYDYSYRGSELWASDLRGRCRLRQLASQTNDDGEQRVCEVRASDPGLKVSGTGGDGAAGTREAYTSTFWCLPAEDVRGKELDLVDLETGKVRKVTLQQTGTANHAVGGACSVWKVRGTPEIELWFDKDGRLVRRVMPRKGRTATVDLISVANGK